jgi:hypothetical protein
VLLEDDHLSGELVINVNNKCMMIDETQKLTRETDGAADAGGADSSLYEPLPTSDGSEPA